MKGHVRKRGSKWCFVIELGRDPQTGKRRQKWVSGFNTKKEAQKAMHEMLVKVAKNEYIEPSKMTFGELVDVWLEQYVHNKCRPRTINTYMGTVRRYIKPYLGKLSINQIKPIHIQQFLNELLRTLQPSTVQIIRSVCKNIFQWAVDMQLVESNPVDRVKPPKTAPREMKYWNEEQVRRFLEAAKDHRYYPVYYLAIFTGMRKGEILGLKWEDIDFEAGRISVKRNLQRIDGHGLILQEAPKTERSRRVVDISDSVVEVLKQHKRRQAEELLLLGIRSDMVFTTTKGKWVDPSWIKNTFHVIAKKAGNPRIRFHDLRHTHATLMLKAGVHPKVVSERLGHSTITITLDTYSHVIPSIQKDAANKLETLISPTPSSVTQNP